MHATHDIDTGLTAGDCDRCTRDSLLELDEATDTLLCWTCREQAGQQREEEAA